MKIVLSYMRQLAEEQSLKIVFCGHWWVSGVGGRMILMGVKLTDTYRLPHSFISGRDSNSGEF